MANIIEARPSVKGFLRKYIGSFAPTIAVVVAGVTSSFMSINGGWLVLWVLIVTFIVLWVLRSKEAGISVFATLVLSFIYFAVKFASIPPESFVYNPRIPEAVFSDTVAFAFFISIIVSILTALGTEAYRRSIRYIVTRDEVVMVGGIWRRQEHHLPYHMIGRVIVEQSLFGRMLNYGTVILVSPASWGEEYYARAVGGVGGRGVGIGVGYARVLQEISRDPMKCLYGISNPHEIANFISEKIKVPFRAYEKELEYFGRLNASQ